MTFKVDTLEPTVLWKHFSALCEIPRGSGNEAAAREYVLAQAKKLGLEATQDKAGNVVIRKPAKPGREKAPMAVLQGHLDMVCEKNEGTQHDFTKDAIKTKRDGDWLKAEGTTLGADNGIGVATGLAVMESTDINHGPLEFVFTVDEETGLTGASEFPAGVLKSKYFLNLDAEEKGTICIGCAGGLNTTGKRKLTKQPAKGNTAWRVKVSGLKGGHSGVDIHQGRGNALRVLGRVLEALLPKGAEVATVNGGSKRNVIPREATAIIVADSAKEKELRAIVSEIETEMKADIGGFDPGLVITLESADTPAQVISAADAKAIVDVLTTLHHGVLAMSPDIPGLVQTSTNLATCNIDGDFVEIGTSQRSAIEKSKQGAGRMVATVLRLAGFDVDQGGGYPGWKPEPDNSLVHKAQEAHKQVFGKQAELVAMHAGLECGVIGEKHPGMEMIAIGPQIVDVHSPNEKVEIPSVQVFWNFMKVLLEKL